MLFDNKDSSGQYQRKSVKGKLGVIKRYYVCILTFRGMAQLNTISNFGELKGASILPNIKTTGLKIGVREERITRKKENRRDLSNDDSLPKKRAESKDYERCQLLEVGRKLTANSTSRKQNSKKRNGLLLVI